MRFPLLAASLLLLASCQPLPHPFAQDVPPPHSPFLAPPDSAGVVVEPVAGAPEPAAHDLAAAMAKALQDNDVPASTSASNRGSYRLVGTAATKDVGSGNVLVTVSWEMHDATGLPVSRQDATLALAAAAWRRGGDGIRDLAREPAPYFAKMVETMAPAPIAGIDPLVAVATITGAPGDGGETLARAMSDALKHVNVDVADTPGAKASYVVEARVDVSPPAGGKQQVKISWSLLNPSGGQLGQVNQENAVPAGSLDRNWGMTAYDVASAAAPGIAALIAEARKVAATKS